MDKIEPHAYFQVITPDEVAETWDGVYHNEEVPELYELLWGLTNFYDNSHRENIEDIGPHDVIGINCVARFWDKLAPTTQEELNRLAIQNDP